MLGRSNDQTVIVGDWEGTAAQAQIPEAMQDRFFDRKGPMPLFHENKRGYHRFYMRGKAVLKRRDAALGTYTRDVSRQGVGFLAPVQLFPQERVKMQLPNAAELHLEVTRCRRVDKGCFDCGARFAL